MGDHNPEMPHKKLHVVRQLGNQIKFSETANYLRAYYAKRGVNPSYRFLKRRISFEGHPHPCQFEEEQVEVKETFRVITIFLEHVGKGIESSGKFFYKSD